jgi:hypothetical protein
MGRVLLTSTYKLKRSTPIQQNVDDDLLNPYIFKAQETHIQQILGTNLYEKIMNDVVANNVTGSYLTLLNDYIVPCLIEWSFYEVMPFISLKITNKTIGRGNADYMAEGDLNDLKYLRQTVRDLAEFYGQRIIGYLKQYSNQFPEYTTNSGLDKIVPNSSNYFSGVYLGGGRSQNCRWGIDDRGTPYIIPRGYER